MCQPDKMGSFRKAFRSYNSCFSVNVEDQQKHQKIQGCEDILPQLDILSMIGQIVKSTEDVNKARGVPEKDSSLLCAVPYRIDIFTSHEELSVKLKRTNNRCLKYFVISL